MVLGFSGAATVPQVLGGTLAEFGCARVTKVQDIEEALRDTILGNYLLLKGSPAVWAVRNRSGPASPEMIGIHSPPDHVWGLELRGCPDLACPWGPGDTKWDCKDPHDKAVATCRRCGLKATIRRTQDLPHISNWGRAHPLIYRSRFPLTIEEFQLAVTNGAKQPPPNADQGIRKRKPSVDDGSSAGPFKLARTRSSQL